MFDPVLVTGFLALFVAVGGIFLAVNLVVGWLVRPRMPNTEKLEVYECGEPTIGSSFVQFDLRFYVVALLFIIFDVEVALFFPWATVFGKATQLADPVVASVEADGVTLTPAVAGVYRELGVANPAVPAIAPPKQFRAAAEAAAAAESSGEVRQLESEWAVAESGRMLARTAVIDMAIFYAVLLIGFAYVWYRGDLDWVRAVANQRASGLTNAGRSS
jgi:NADH-quinone oxidoreductase subunit A